MKIKRKLINFMNKLPYIRGLYQENIHFKKIACFPPGHYYSSIIDVDEIKERQDEIWLNGRIEGIDGISLKTKEQIELVSLFQQYYKTIPFGDEKRIILDIILIMVFFLIQMLYFYIQ